MVKNRKELQYDKEKAKALYMDYVPVAKIAREVGASRSTLQYHVHEYWRAERELKKAELMQALAESKSVEITSMTESAITIMKKALLELANREKAPTITEATQASNILMQIDKITRLDESKPTDIVSNSDKPLTIIEVQKKISLDPFADQIEDVETKEIENEE